MSVQITIIGLHQVGSSIGWALSRYKDKIECTGYDESLLQADKAASLKVFAHIESNFAASVRDADLVILAVPAGAVHELLGILPGYLKEHAQVIDTSILHQGMGAYAASVLKPGNPFITATPILNPDYLNEDAQLLDEAHADLFERGALLICNGPDTGAEMIKVAADLAQLLGAHAYFTDPFEADVLLAEVELLPGLAAAALMNTAASNPGWEEHRRVAGGAFYKSTFALGGPEEKGSLAGAALQSKEVTLKALKRLQSRLDELYAAIEKNDADELGELLDFASGQRQAWLEYKRTVDWNSSTGAHQENMKDVSRLMWNGFRKKPK